MYYTHMKNLNVYTHMKYTHTHIYMCSMDVLVNLMGGILSQLYGYQVTMMYTLFIYWQNRVA